MTPTGEECRNSKEKDLANGVYRVTAMNAVSLFWGVVGNIFLLLNFTQNVRYIIALPVTIVSWFLATGIVSGRCLVKFDSWLTSTLALRAYCILAHLQPTYPTKRCILAGILERCNCGNPLFYFGLSLDDQHARLLPGKVPPALLSHG
jgi:hypothetical protein